MTEFEFVSGDDDSADNVSALIRGELTPWRICNGVQWYKRAIRTEAVPPMIQAVPDDEYVADEVGDDIEADDVELADDDDSDQPGLDDFERAQLQQWADDLRTRAIEEFDNERTDDDPESTAD